MSMDMSNYAATHYGGTPVADDARSNYTEGFMIVEENNYAVEGNYTTGTTRQRGLAAMATSNRGLPLNFRPATATPTMAATDAGMSGINYDDEMDTTEATTANYGMRAHYTGGLTADELRQPSSDLRYKDVRPTTQAQWSHFRSYRTRTSTRSMTPTVKRPSATYAWSTTRLSRLLQTTRA